MKNSIWKNTTSDELPEFGMDVLLFENGAIQNCIFCLDGNDDGEDTSVIFWTSEHKGLVDCCIGVNEDQKWCYVKDIPKPQNKPMVEDTSKTFRGFEKKENQANAYDLRKWAIVIAGQDTVFDCKSFDHAVEKCNELNIIVLENIKPHSKSGHYPVSWAKIELWEDDGIGKHDPENTCWDEPFG